MCSVVNLEKHINLEIMEIKTVEFLANGAHVFSRRVIVARAWTKHEGLSKVRNSFWLGREGHNLICLAADATRKVVNKTVFENVLRSRATGHF